MLCVKFWPQFFIDQFSLTTIASITWSGQTVFLFFAPQTLFALADKDVRKVMHSYMIISLELVLILASFGSFSMIREFTVATMNTVVIMWNSCVFEIVQQINLLQVIMAITGLFCSLKRPKIKNKKTCNTFLRYWIWWRNSFFDLPLGKLTSESWRMYRESSSCISSSSSSSPASSESFYLSFSDSSCFFAKVSCLAWDKMLLSPLVPEIAFLFDFMADLA